ncbi:hypothetical protein [Pseudomonas fluorescens]|nr:hypothetical protein [Pseudomonas fluorescens]
MKQKEKHQNRLSKTIKKSAPYKQLALYLPAQTAWKMTGRYLCFGETVLM